MLNQFIRRYFITINTNKLGYSKKYVLKVKKFFYKSFIMPYIIIFYIISIQINTKQEHLIFVYTKFDILLLFWFVFREALVQLFNDKL